MIVYSYNWCGYCIDLKNWLKEMGIDFELRNPDEYLEELRDLNWNGGVPLIIIGDQIIQGFNKEKIQEIYSELGQSGSPLRS